MNAISATQRLQRVTCTVARCRRLANIVCAIAPVIVSGLTEARLFGPRTTGELSAQYPTLVVPASYAFAIWGPIFGLCCAYAVYQALLSQHDNALLGKVGWWTAAAFTANAMWPVAFQTERFRVAEALIFTTLLSLAGAFVGILRLGRPLTKAEWWLVEVPLGVFFGWITVANVANAAQVLVAYGWNGWGFTEVQWSVALLLLGGLVAALVTATSGSRAYALAVVWALAGIVVNQRETALAVAATAGTLIVVILLVLARAPALRRTGWQSGEAYPARSTGGSKVEVTRESSLRS